jgi:hypothetical protein
MEQLVAAFACVKKLSLSGRAAMAADLLALKQQLRAVFPRLHPLPKWRFADEWVRGE